MATLIESIYINRGYAGNRSLEGKIKFSNQRGEVSVNLDAAKVAKIVAVLADLLVETAQDTAQLMVSDVLEQSENQSLPAPIVSTSFVDHLP